MPLAFSNIKPNESHSNWLSQSTSLGNGLLSSLIPYKSPVTAPKQTQPMTQQNNQGSVFPLVKTANAQTTPQQAKPTQNIQQPVQQIPVQQPVQQPQAQPSYQGGQAVPTIGTPEYERSVQMNRQPQNKLVQQPVMNQSTQQNQGIPGLFQQATGNLLNIGQNGSPFVQQKVNEAQQFQKDYGQTQADIAGNPNLSLDTKTGIGQIVANRYATQNAANQQAVTNALGQQNQQVTALGSAANQASPIQVPYSNQLVNPLNGQSVNSGNTSLNDAVNLMAQKLKTGTISYNDAVSALGGYGQGGVNALNQALGSGFNISQSNTLAGQQGSIGPAFDYAKAALASLQSTLANLGTAQGTNIPAINAIGDWFSQNSGINSEATRAYKAGIAEARSAIQKVLASVQGGTPTDYVAQSTTLLPDNATPNDIAAAISTLDSLGTAKVGIYGNPGLSGQSPTQTTNPTPTTWDSL